MLSILASYWHSMVNSASIMVKFLIIQNKSNPSEGDVFLKFVDAVMLRFVIPAAFYNNMDAFCNKKAAAFCNTFLPRFVIK